MSLLERRSKDTTQSQKRHRRSGVVGAAACDVADSEGSVGSAVDGAASTSKYGFASPADPSNQAKVVEAAGTAVSDIGNDINVSGADDVEEQSLNESLDEETIGTEGSLNAFLSVKSTRNPADPVERQLACEEPGWIWMLRCSQVSSGSNSRTHVMHLHSHIAPTFVITPGRSSHRMHLDNLRPVNAAMIVAVLLSNFGPRMQASNCLSSY